MQKNHRKGLPGNDGEHMAIAIWDRLCYNYCRIMTIFDSGDSVQNNLLKFVQYHIKKVSDTKRIYYVEG